MLIIVLSVCLQLSSLIGLSRDFEPQETVPERNAVSRLREVRTLQELPLESRNVMVPIFTLTKYGSRWTQAQVSVSRWIFTAVSALYAMNNISFALASTLTHARSRTRRFRIVLLWVTCRCRVTDVFHIMSTVMSARETTEKMRRKIIRRRFHSVSIVCMAKVNYSSASAAASFCFNFHVAT